MDYFDAARFFEGFSDEDKVRLYSVFGGVQYYARLVDPNISVRQNIQQLVTTPGARLERAVSTFLRSELSKVTNANGAFEALAQGYSKFNDILSQSHASSSPALVDVLNKLIDMEIVERRTPINDRENKREARYHICDSLTSFYYRYASRYAARAVRVSR